MESGWKEHIPLYLLTDSYCQSREASARHDASIQIKGNKLVTSSAGVLPTDRDETALDIREWSQAWRRLIRLIREYFSNAYAEEWNTHFNRIFNHHDRDREWPAMIRYCIAVRMRAVESSIDPEVWHHPTYDRILHELRYPSSASIMSMQPQAPIQPQVKSAASSANGSGPPPSYRSSTKSNHQPHTPSNHKHKPADKQAKCFRCGIPGHKPRNCANDFQANGKIVIVRNIPGTRNWQIDGAGFCYNYNTTSGCAIILCPNPPPTSAPYAAALPTGPNSAQADPRRVVTALLPDAWESLLRDLGLGEEFADVPVGLRAGFRIGAAGPVTHTLIHKNHNSALSHPDAVTNHIHTEHAAGRYSGPFDRDSLEALIGPFQTAPLGVVDKPSSPGKFRIIQDFSFPRDHSFTSLNSQINPDEFTCSWGFFADVMAAVANAPPGSIAATLDVDAAYRQMPVHIMDQPHTVIAWDGEFWVDHCVPFGAASSNGIFGRCGDAMALVYSCLGFGMVFKWVDDFLFLHYPATRFSPSKHSTFGNLDAIYEIAKS